MIASATLPHHLNRRWTDFWKEKERNGVSCIVREDDAIVFHGGKQVATFPRASHRDDINAQLAQIYGKEV